jgi:putative membrane protein
MAPKYTYAENPFGYWLQDVLHLSRNHYDRIVHFCFGFLLAYPMREMFLKWLKYPRWVALAIAN